MLSYFSKGFSFRVYPSELSFTTLKNPPRAQFWSVLQEQLLLLWS